MEIDIQIVFFECTVEPWAVSWLGRVHVCADDIMIRVAIKPTNVIVNPGVKSSPPDLIFVVGIIFELSVKSLAPDPQDL